MLFVTIEVDMYTGKEFIHFCNDDECILMELRDKKYVSVPYPGGRIHENCIPDLIRFLKESLNAPSQRKES